MMKKIYLFVILLFYINCTEAKITSLEKKQVIDYCKNYQQTIFKMARTSSENLNIQLHNANVFQSILNRAFQFVTPPHSHFAKAYVCKSINKNKSFKSDVTLLLTFNQKFAEYTKWENINLTGIGEVKGVSNKTSYYIVVKYLNLFLNGKQAFIDNGVVKLKSNEI